MNSLDPRRNLADAAAQLDRAGDRLQRLNIVIASVVELIRLLYKEEGAARPNIDDIGTILIPVPWGSAGWRHWDIRKGDAAVMRHILLMRRGARPFHLAADSRRWVLDVESYPTSNDCLIWLRDEGPTLTEWARLVQARQEQEAERQRTRRAHA